MRAISACRAAPSGPASAKSAENRTHPPAPASAQLRTASTAFAAGTATTTASTGRPTASIVGKLFRPWTSARPGLIGWIGPAKPASRR